MKTIHCKGIKIRSIFISRYILIFNLFRCFELKYNPRYNVVYDMTRFLFCPSGFVIENYSAEFSDRYFYFTTFYFATRNLAFHLLLDKKEIVLLGEAFDSCYKLTALMAIFFS